MRKTAADENRSSRRRVDSGPETKFERVEISPRERETEREAHTRDDDDGCWGDDDKEQGMYAENGKYTRRILCGKK